MGVADRLVTPGGGDDSIRIAPAGDRQSDNATLFDDGLNIDGSTDASGDSKNVLRPTPAVVYDADSLTRDIRSLQSNSRGRVVKIVSSDAAGADTWTLSFKCDPDDIPGYVKGTADTDGVFTTGTLQDDDTAATVQTAIRAALPGADLTVVEGSAMTFYVIFDRKFWPRQYPLVTFTGTGCTATLTTPTDLLQDDYGAALRSARDQEINQLGESGQVSESDAIVRPIIGTVTVNAGVDAVHKFTYGAGTDGGTVSFGYRGGAVPGVVGPRGGTTGGINWDDDIVTWQGYFDDTFGTDAPTVSIFSGAEELTLDLGDIGAGDTYKLTYGTIPDECAAAITYAADSTVAIQAKVDELLGADKAVVTQVDANTYTILKTNGGAFETPFTVTSISGGGADFTPKVDAGYTLGGKVTTAAGDLVWYFTWENGERDGRPVPLYTLYVVTDALTDGGAAEPGTLASATTGVLGDISAAYTMGTNDTILAAAINDTTGDHTGFSSDAGTPVVLTGLVPGAYHLVIRGVEDGRVSKADSKAFTMTSA